MYKKKSIKWLRNVLLHLIMWISYALLYHLINYSYQPEEYKPLMLDTIGKYLIAAFIFYYNALFAMPRYLNKSNYIKYIVLLIALFFISSLFKQVFYTYVLPLFGYPREIPYTFLQSFLMNTWWVSQYTLIAFGYWFATIKIHYEREQSSREKDILRLEKEKIIAEYEMLKSQINPHFFYNILNFFYAKSLSGPNELTTGIEKLSEIMRYSLQRNEDEAGLVLITEEIMQIKRIIEINALRFQNLNFAFKEEGCFTDIKIIPHVMLTFIENVFKHGDVTNKSPVVLEICYNNGTFNFFCKNVKQLDTGNTSTGIGLENIRKRLQLSYQTRHTLSIKEDTNTFLVNLKISLQ
ncbi:sensor histidine kinase [Chitinophaga nivalis]|uniref:Histidine kinase n=1 Tax=Chitinophaga nivalis TaxID=2991709 RepID=A0ABT3II91_9BACT|nr:sensor histidine kinase [Chitinophaga nivalis]MCW3466633.1 histidine kinase [Chitinophaga nivalis]MCW3483676.1 histidine kinase [Chitinophaga nivalis]